MIPAPVIRITDAWLFAGANESLQDRLRVYTSLEGENPGGSIKDHMVQGELSELLAGGRLREGDCVSEVSSGYTALAIAHYARQMGLRSALFIPREAPDELERTLLGLGARVFRVELHRAMDEYAQFTARNKVCPFSQFGDAGKRRHYKRFARSLQERLGRIDILVGAVGTGHSLLGTARREPDPQEVVSAEPRALSQVPGIRNLDDPWPSSMGGCHPGEIDRRIVLRDDERFPADQVATDAGPVMITPSFRVVLGAVRLLLREEASHPRAGDWTRTLFALGAANRR